MVERLKIAIEKARAERQKQTTAFVESPEALVERAFEPSKSRAATAPLTTSVTTVALPDEDPAARQAQARHVAWAALQPLDLNQAHLEQNRLQQRSQNDTASMAFDTLRTRIRRAFAKHGWSRLGITSPTKGCGKTFVAANLALSFARQADCRTLLMDMDLRLPNLDKVLGVEDPEPITWFLSGDVPAQEYLYRVGPNLGVGLNAKAVPDAAEVIQASSTNRVLSDMIETYAPEIAIYDLPPMLSCDDVLAFLGQLDCVLLVVGGGQTVPSDVTECERLLADQTHLLGVLLNRGEGADGSASVYGAP